MSTTKTNPNMLPIGSDPGNLVALDGEGKIPLASSSEVARTGNYNDLTDKPTIGNDPGDLVALDENGKILADQLPEIENDPLAGQWVEVSRVVSTGDTFIDFTFDDSADEWAIYFRAGSVSTSYDLLGVRFSIDGGDTFMDGSTDYRWMNASGETGEFKFIEVGWVGEYDNETGTGQLITEGSLRINPFSKSVIPWIFVSEGLIYDNAIISGNGRTTEAPGNAIRFLSEQDLTGIFVLYKRVKP